jgi:hypothetical protein
MLSRDLVDGINLALNESELLDVDVDRSTRTGHISFRVLTLGPDGVEPTDRVARFTLHDVPRVVASLRHGRWDDDQAPIEHFSLADLSSVVAGFGGLPIYGWEFIDPPEASTSSRRHVRQGAHRAMGVVVRTQSPALIPRAAARSGELPLIGSLGVGAAPGSG